LKLLLVLLAPAVAADHSTDWILVQLETPLRDRNPDGSFVLFAGLAALDAAIAEAGIQRIDHALTATMQAPRDAAGLAAHGLDRVYRFHLPPGADIGASIRRFASLDEVVFAEPDAIYRPTGTLVPDDTLFVGQWAFDQPSDADVDGPEAWATDAGDRVNIAILDSGIISHAEFTGKVLPGIDIANADNDPVDVFNHGTAVAAIAAAKTDNALGVAGTCWGCKLIPIQVFDDKGDSFASWLADGFIWAADNGADVVNFSGSGPHADLVLAAIQYAYGKGVLLFNSTGNTGAGVLFPAKYRETIAIGNSTKTDTRQADSSGGQYMDVLAPGDGVLTLTNTGTYANFFGTSAAAPLAAGLGAIVRDLHPSVGHEEARQLVFAGADDQVGGASDAPGWDADHAWGRVNMERTLLGAQAVTTLRAAGGANTRLFYETANPLADSYDFIRGDLSSLSESMTGVELGSVVCVENDSPDADTTGDEDSTIPASGQGFFHLGRFNSGPWPASYGGASSHRDRLTPDPAHPADWFQPADRSNAQFGLAVDSAGDVDNDGIDDVIVGAPSYEQFPGMGAAFVHLGSLSGLASGAVWMTTSAQSESQLGASVAGAGDVNNDGFDDVVVSEHFYDGVTEDEGRVMVYLGSAAGPQSTAHVILSDPQEKARFGTVVKAAGDVNNDGFDDVIVSAPLYDNGQTNEGRAYLYHGSGSGLTNVPAWTYEANQGNARLRAVGAAGDVNDDGFDDVLVGAPRYNGVDTNEGRVWLFLGSASGLSSAPSATLTVGGDNSRFGRNVSTAGDVNDDTRPDVVITAGQWSNGQTNEGAAFVFLGTGSGLATAPVWSFETDQAQSFILSAQGAGDVNDDGYDDIVVGSDAFELTRLYEGKVFLFYGSAGGPSSTPDWSEMGWQVDARLGSEVSDAGDVNGDGIDDFIFGIPGYHNGGFSEGATLVFHGSASPPAVVQPAGCDVPSP